LNNALDVQGGAFKTLSICFQGSIIDNLGSKIYLLIKKFLKDTTVIKKLMDGSMAISKL
jgi:hypothetical protein